MLRFAVFIVLCSAYLYLSHLLFDTAYKTTTIQNKTDSRMNGHDQRTIRVLLLRNKQGIHAPHELLSGPISPTEYCEFHGNVNLLNESDAVIMKAELLMDEDDIPQRSSPSQQWIYFSWEAAKDVLINENPRHNNHFNMTMTYSKHSDIFFPYGKCHEVQTNKSEVENHINYILRNKSKLVGWLLSSCRSQSSRENYARELMKHIPVDIYGECGNRTCDKRSKYCRKLIFTYKFYLAFENNLCGEYMTEKLWKSYERNIVPVVFGGLDAYRAVLPAHSYIAASDFSSPKDLANHLVMLDQNPELYRRHFDWKYTHICRGVTLPEKAKIVCQYLHSHITDIKSNLSLLDMWSADSNKCADRTTYLPKLGVTDLRRRRFTKHDVHIYDNVRKLKNVTT